MILQALNAYYERIATNEPTAIAQAGFSDEKISFCVVLSADGEVVDINDLRVVEGRRLVPRIMTVPASVKRPGTTPRSFFLWDKTAFALGVTKGKDGKLEFTPRQHTAFRELHQKRLTKESDVGLQALRRFVERWTPQHYVQLRYANDMLDTNVVFRLDGTQEYLHERTAARRSWEAIGDGPTDNTAVCLVTGVPSQIARIHPPIRGMPGQTTGGSIVAFNQSAFTSYGFEQGSNAPVSDKAAFAYTTALNRLLLKATGQRTEIGDATTVYWAVAATAPQAKAAEKAVGWLFDPPSNLEADTAETTRLRREVLDRVAQGKGLECRELHLSEGTSFYILGLVAPDPARISIRYWEATTLGAIGRAFHQHWRDLHMERRTHSPPPSVAACVLMTAPARPDKSGKYKMDFDGVSPVLGGELMRAILSSGRYPASLLTNLVMRIRTDGYINRLRISLIKAVLVRAMRLDGRLPAEDYLVRTDPTDPNPARRLGRLFAVLERAQLAALGDAINSTIKDKYISSAAATPAQVFPFLVKNSQHHTSRLKRGRAEAKWISDPRRAAMAFERDIGLLWAGFNDGLPTQLSAFDQGLFFVGYFQERFGGKADADVGDDTPKVEDNEQSDNEE